MIRFLFGDNGGGKTERILHMLSEDAKNGIPSILIVPEQQAVQTEILTLETLPPSAQLTLEVLNFSRLYNRVCREYGGLCYSYITKPMKHLMMWRALRQTAPLLKRYGDNAVNDPAFVKTMLSAVGELKSCNIRIDDLEQAARLCGEEKSALSERLEDIMTVYAVYDALVSEKYSDSADDLSKLCDILKEHDFFKGKNVYIDSFTSFTAAEHRIIERIFATADNTAVTVPLPRADYSDISTASIELSLRTLKKHADRWGGHEDTVIEGARTNAHPAITYLYENLWNMNAANRTEAAPPCDGHIVAEICDTSYAEAEAVASHMLELLRDGARCREMVVIMRDAEKYRGIIEPALDSADIPFFFSEKTDVCALPAIKLILTALRIYRFNWRKNDIISHIKTGLCDFPLRDADLFEEYINTWNISGSRFTDGDWTMNPDGYVDRTSARGEVILRTANRIRRALCEPLHELFVLLEAASGAPDMCRALYAYMEKTGLEKKLRELALRERTDGNLKTAEELDSVYGVILRSLADIAEALSDTAVSVDEFADILKMVFDQTEIGTIPTSVDEVTIGSASLLRASDPKYVFVMGLCEGEFPANVDDTGIFTSSDRETLTELGVELGGDNDTRSSDELMFVKKAFGAPTDRLYLFTSASGIKGENRTPSLPFRRVETIFPDLKAHRFSGNDLSFLCGSPASAAAHLRNITNASDRLAATEAVAEHLPLVRELSRASATDTKCRVDKELVRGLVGDTIYISPSSLEKYVKCPFSYYTGYMLSLREKQYGSFRANNFGSFVHFVLEHMISFAVPADTNSPIPTHEEILRETERIVTEYIGRIAPDEALNTKRMAHIYNKLKKLSVLLIENTVKEFADCDFRPAFFELHTDGRDDGPRPLEIPLDGGTRVVLKGIIDRVDLWKKDGKVYVRIVDYKTGSKDFSLEDVSHGLNTQMLLYLFSVCRDPGMRFRISAGLENGEPPVPAGIVYLSSALPKVEIKDYGVSDEEVLLRTEEELSRSGILLDDEEIIHAFSHSDSKSLLLGVSKNKNGEYTGKALISGEAFDELYGQIESTIRDIGNSIYSGIADSTPLRYGDNDPCKYCTVKPICRKNNYT
ncbi:MAG: PD-(D/E)XK nuclease family protein [Clostridia bacterium]|nr:PD-(D/E)XK nuclease family protein [Clostridia bacterium]